MHLQKYDVLVAEWETKIESYSRMIPVTIPKFHPNFPKFRDVIPNFPKFPDITPNFPKFKISQVVSIRNDAFAPRLARDLAFSHD